MKNVIAFIVAAVLCASIVLIASVLFFPDQDNDDSFGSGAVTTDLTVSQSDSRAALFGFCFSLDGEEYSLPCGYSAFERNGWVMRNPSETIDGASNMTGVYLKRMDSCLKTEIINYGSDPVMCCKGQIHSVSASVSDFNAVSIPGAITCDKSTTPIQVRQTLGEPDYINENDELISLEYRKSEHQKVLFEFYKRRSYDYGGHPQSEDGYGGEQLDSGYYGHIVILECRKDS